MGSEGIAAFVSASEALELQRTRSQMENSSYFAETPTAKLNAESKPATVADSLEAGSRQDCSNAFQCSCHISQLQNPRFGINESPRPVQHGMHVLTPSLQVQISYATGTRHVHT